MDDAHTKPHMLGGSKHVRGYHPRTAIAAPRLRQEIGGIWRRASNKGGRPTVTSCLEEVEVGVEWRHDVAVVRPDADAGEAWDGSGDSSLREEAH